MLIKNIRWDTDGNTEALASLPTEVHTPPFLDRENTDLDSYLDDVSDWLSDDSHSQTKTSNMRRE